MQSENRPNIEQIAIPGYAILNKLGGGGTSEVYRAFDSHDRSIVAVKIFTRTPNDIDRLIRRLLVWAELEHPNLVRVVSHSGITRAPRPYIVLEYLPGGDLRSRCWSGIKLSEAIRVLAEIAATLDYLHSHNVFHLDLKPENVLFTAQGQAKLSDLDSSAYEKHGLDSRKWPTYGVSLFDVPKIQIHHGEWTAISLPDDTETVQLDWLQFCLMAYEVLTGTILPRRILYLDTINKQVPDSLARAIYHYIDSSAERNQVDIHRELEVAKTQVTDDVVIKTNWQEHLANDCELEAYSKGLYYSSVGVAGSVFSSELGFMTYDRVSVENLLSEVDDARISNAFSFFNSLGCVAFSREEYNAALDCFRRAARAQNRLSIVHYNVVVTMIKLGLIQQAVEYAKSVQASGNRSIEVEISLMIALSASDPFAAYQMARDILGANETRLYKSADEFTRVDLYDEQQLREEGMGVVPCELAAHLCYRARDYRLARALMARAMRLSVLT